MKDLCQIYYQKLKDWLQLPSSASSTNRGVHRIDVDIDALTARVSDIASIVAVPFGATADGAAIFHGVALSCLELRVGEEHDHAVAATSRTATTASSEGWTLVSADDRAVRLENLDGITMLGVDFQRRLGANVLCRVAGAATRADRGAARNLELVPVAVEAFFR